MIREKSLIIAAASTPINLNHSINFSFLSFSFSLGQVLQISQPEQLLRRVLLYFIVLFPAHFSCPLFFSLLIFLVPCVREEL